jgi:ribonuclease HI
MIIIFTDGSCHNNTHKNGGWGAILRFDGDEKEIFGGCKGTTSNRMELTAPLEALKALKRHDLPITIHSDSQYLIKGMNEWSHNWQRNGWKNSNGELVINRDLWVELLKWNKKLKIKWVWVRGHAGHPDQEIAHELASRGTEEAMKVQPRTVNQKHILRRRKTE